MSATVLGIDEAGRGPVLGPLVITVVEWTAPSIPREVKLEDSKKLSSTQRRDSAGYLRNKVNYRTQFIPAWVISRSDSITQLEALCISKMLNSFSPQPVLCDSLGSGNKAEQYVKNQNPNYSIQFEKKADDNYPSVAAASIIAKTARDDSLETLRKNWGSIGSGYPSDPTTRTWLKNWKNAEDRDWPAFVRTSWSTVDTV